MHSSKDPGPSIINYERSLSHDVCLHHPYSDRFMGQVEKNCLPQCERRLDLNYPPYSVTIASRPDVTTLPYKLSLTLISFTHIDMFAVQHIMTYTRERMTLSHSIIANRPDVTTIYLPYTFSQHWKDSFNLHFIF